MENPEIRTARPGSRPGIAMNRFAMFVCGALVFMAGIVVGRGGLRAEHVNPGIKADYETFYSQGLTLALVRKVIRDRYVAEVDDKTLIQGALRGMTGSLDEYSEFMDEEEYEELRMESEGEFEGIGIVVTARSGCLEVITPISGTPAARAGIMPGDRIIEVEGKSTAGMTITHASTILRGKQGTAVNLRVTRAGAAEPVIFTIIREKIHTPSVHYEMLRDGCGYLRLSAFTEKAAKEFEAGVNSLAAGGAKSIVLDLRNNGGGLLESAVDICDLLLASGTIVSTRGRVESDNLVFSAGEGGTLPSLPLAVLVNEASASAAEIVAGAVADHGRGRLVGAPTFGKGSVQTIIPMSDGSALKLTTARYHTPAGRTFSHEKDGSGIRPDHEVLLTPEQKTRVYGTLSGGKPDPDSDPQLAKALEILTGR